MNSSRVKLWFGKLLNLAGFPGLVRECDYHSRALDTVVRVRKLGLYTIVTVNAIDVYFERFTGTIDGVGASCQPSDYIGTRDSGCNDPELAREPSCPPPPIRNKNR